MVKKRKGLFAGILSAAVATAMFVSLMPKTNVYASDDKVTNMDGFQATLVADADTSQNKDIFNGSPAEDGKIWTDKSVTTGSIYGATAGEKNFNVALSAMGQTYSTVTTSMETTEHKVAYDVVFVMDFSGSMVNDSKASNMVSALNTSMSTLMENEDNRVSIVAYSGSSANPFLPLDHYKTSNADENFLSYSSRNNQISVVRGVTNSDNDRISKRQSVSGGTPTQQGIHEGLNVLKNASKSDDLVRIPTMVLLTDGKAGIAYSGYTNLSGTKYQGSAQGQGSSAYDDEVGAYTILTANYAKDELNRVYKDKYNYNGILQDYNDETSMVSKFYTIGLGIKNDEWTHFMMDPSTDVDFGRDDANIVDGIKGILNRDSEYKNNYNYSDKYFGGQNMSEEDLQNAFKDILASMEVTPEISTDVNNPVEESTGGTAKGSLITFTDYLGYKMELKGEKQYLRYNGVNYRFSKRSDGTYKFDPESGTGPVITDGEETYTLNDVEFKAEFDADYEMNGQTGYYKVTWSFPSALLPMYSRANDYETEPRPIRMLYEVGLIEEEQKLSDGTVLTPVDMKKDGIKIDANGNMLDANAKKFHDYAFYTNLYDFNNKTALTTVDFKPALDNPYYYETGYTTENVSENKYLRVDVETSKNATETITADAEIELINLSISDDGSTVSFKYDDKSYSVDMSGDWNRSGVVELRDVTATTKDGTEIVEDVDLSFEVSRSGWINPVYKITSIKCGETEATLTGNTASLTVTLSEERPIESTGVEIVSVYLELKHDQKGWYVEDLNGKRIDVEEMDDGTYKITLGATTYYSNVYYKYPEGQISYTNKNLDKGEVTKSFVGRLEIKQPENIDDVNSENFQNYFTYHSADGTTETNATGVLFPENDNRNYWGTIGDLTNRPTEGTFRVAVDDIENKQNPDVLVNFDFDLEIQKVEDGKKYVALDAAYWVPEGNNDYSVDIHLSDTPEVKDGSYFYDVSYTITRNHPDAEGNETHTNNQYFQSSLTNTGLDLLLGNNGRVSVLVDEETYAKDVSVVKQWLDDDGNPITQVPTNLSINAGLFQKYSYKDADGKEIDFDGTTSPFDVQTLNSSNSYSYTWTKESLPKYLVDDGGNYVLDYTDANNPTKVEVEYVVREVDGVSGWISAEGSDSETDAVHTFVLNNIQDAEIEPTATKTWTKNDADEIPDGYKIKLGLYANDNIVTSAHSVDTTPVVVTLEQSAQEDGTLSVKYLNGITREQDVHLSDFTKTTKTKVYKFDFGELGNKDDGTYAKNAIVRITIDNNSGDRLGISKADIAYIQENGDETSATIATPKSVERTDDGTSVKTATYTMEYMFIEDAVIILDGTEDADGETKAWAATWSKDKWHLPSIEKDEQSGEWKDINYTVKETLMVPDQTESNGYKEYSPDDTTGLITVDGKELYKSTIKKTTPDGYSFEINNDLNNTSRTASKVWVDNDNAYETRPNSIEFVLEADGDLQEDTRVTITPDKNADIWNGTDNVEWTDLPKYNSDGEEIEYTLVENKKYGSGKDDEYKTTVSTDKDDSQHFIVTNQLNPELNNVEINVEKTWIDNDNQYNTRPENLYLVLYRNVDGSSADDQQYPGATPIVLKKDATELSGSWDNLPKYNEEGKQYEYTVKEFDSNSFEEEKANKISNYTSSEDVDDNTHTFTNELTGKSISKTVNKVWKDAAVTNRPDSITVKLFGKTEDGIVDLNNKDDKETSLTKTIKANSEGIWIGLFENLPEYYGGKKIDYTIEETSIGNDEVIDGKAGKYKVSVADDGNGDTFTITNTLDASTNITVEKEWNNTPDGFVIPEVEFNVYGKNKSAVLDTLRIQGNTEETISATSKDLPMYDKNGEVIEYTVKEENIEDDGTYIIDSVISENTGANGLFKFKASNTYRELEKDITVTKQWKNVSGNNIPESITVQLYKGTELIEEKEIKPSEDEKVIVDEEKNTWTYTFTDLPIYEDENDINSKYVYSIKETKVGETTVNNGTAGDYTVTVTPEHPTADTDAFTITNSLGGNVDQKDLAGTKTWVDINGDSLPESIEVQLLRTVDDAKYEKVGDVIKVEPNLDGTWTYQFGSDLPKYNNVGKEYTYVVKETKVGASDVNYGKDVDYATSGTVGAYDVKLDGMDITNTLQSGSDKDKTTFKVDKQWKDKDGKDLTSNLPTSITVELTGKLNGRPIDINGSNVEGETLTQVIQANNEGKWTHTFTDLDKFADDGITPVEYSVNEIKIDETMVENDEAGLYSVEVENKGYEALITNTLTQNPSELEKTSLTITKKWEGILAGNAPSIKVELYQDGKTFKNVTLSTENVTVDPEKNTWSYKFDELDEYFDNGILKHVYTAKEIEVNDVLVNNNKAGDYDVTHNENGTEITNKLSGTVKSISGNKVWKDNGNENKTRPEELKIGLYRSSQKEKFNKIEECTLSGDNLDFVFNNNDSGYPKYDSEGNLYKYEVRELDTQGNPVSDGGTVNFIGEGDSYKVTYGTNANDPTVTTITNTLFGEYNPNVNPLQVTKVWLDNNNAEAKRPASINVKLLQNGKFVEEIALTKENATQPDTSQPVQPILPEETQPDQPVVGEEESEVTETTESIDQGTEAQDQQNLETSQDQVESINETLEQPVVEETPIVGENSNNWQGKFTQTYPKYDENGKLIEYTVEETPVENYTLQSTEGDVGSGWKLTNVYAPGQMSITINKKWVDNNNAEGTRPDSIDVVLVRSDGYETPVTLTAAANWTNTINVESTDPNGVMYSYSVREVNKIGDYVASVDGYTITNTLTGTENVSGEKKWNNISEENRPKDVTIALYRQVGNNPVEVVVDANGNPVTAIVNKETEWKYNFGDLNKYDENGAKITYSVKETMVNGVPIEETDYASKVDGYNVENSIKEGLDLNIKGTKTWVDNDNEYKTRPLSIKVNLLANGKVVDTATVSEKTNWSYEFNDLPKYDMSNGALLTYTIDEETVGNYDKVINGFDIVNKLKDEAIPKPDPKPEDPKPEKPADPEKPSSGKDNANTATQTYAGMFVSMMTSAASLAGILAILKKRREI